MYLFIVIQDLDLKVDQIVLLDLKHMDLVVNKVQYQNGLEIKYITEWVNVYHTKGKLILFFKIIHLKLPGPQQMQSVCGKYPRTVVLEVLLEDLDLKVVLKAMDLEVKVVQVVLPVLVLSPMDLALNHMVLVLDLSPMDLVLNHMVLVLSPMDLALNHMVLDLSPMDLALNHMVLVLDLSPTDLVLNHMVLVLSPMDLVLSPTDLVLKVMVLDLNNMDLDLKVVFKLCYWFWISKLNNK